MAAPPQVLTRISVALPEALQEQVNGYAERFEADAEWVIRRGVQLLLEQDSSEAERLEAGKRRGSADLTMFNVRIPKADKVRLQREAERRGMTISELSRERLGCV